MREINEIIIHCTDTPYNTTVQSIKNHHTNVNGWADIGYHFLLDSSLTWHVGRPVIQIGAHVKGHNTKTIGVAYIGKTPTVAMVKEMARFCNLLIAMFKIKTVSRHTFYDKNKSCPNFARGDIDTFDKICDLKLQ